MDLAPDAERLVLPKLRKQDASVHFPTEPSPGSWRKFKFNANKSLSITSTLWETRIGSTCTQSAPRNPQSLVMIPWTHSSTYTKPHRIHRLNHLIQELSLPVPKLLAVNRLILVLTLSLPIHSVSTRPTMRVSRS